MAAGKRLIFDRIFSLPLVAGSGRIKVFRAGPEGDVFVTLEVLAPDEAPARLKTGRPAPARA